MALPGRKYGSATVLSLSKQKTKNNRKLWNCRCDCGNTYLSTTWSLTDPNGHKSCGCQNVIVRTKFCPRCGLVKPTTDYNLVGHFERNNVCNKCEGKKPLGKGKNPTPEEIRKRCLHVQKTWDEETELKRRARMDF